MVKVELVETLERNIKHKIKMTSDYSFKLILYFSYFYKIKIMIIQNQKFQSSNKTTFIKFDLTIKY